MPESNKVKFGLENVHYALLTTAEDGAVTFGTPKPIKGAVNMSLSPQGDTETFYADNIAYYVSTANNGYQGDLEMALVPDDFRVDVLGDELDETDQVLVEKADAEPKPFALLYQVRGDKFHTRRAFYNCAAARPTENNQTVSNTKTPNTESLTLTCSPLENGMVKAKTTANTPAATYEGWFEKVWMPGQGTSAQSLDQV